MTRPVLYLSGPISLPDMPAGREHNFLQAAEAQKRLMAAGFSVINPMLSMKLPGNREISHADWIRNDLPIIDRVDAVLRLPGKSVGADQECRHAKDNGVAVFGDEGELLDWKEALDTIKGGDS